MENLQKLIPIFQEQFDQWYDLTLHHQDYAAFITVSIWLLTSIFYSIRIGFLKRQTAKIVAAKNQTQANLDVANQELQNLQQQLSEAAQALQAEEAKLQTETERAQGLEQHLQQSLQQLVASMTSMAECFELTLQQTPTADNPQLLSEYQALNLRIKERFQNEQQAKTQLQLNLHAEAAKHSEKDILISSLESRLQSQTQQLAQLTLAVEQHEAAQRQFELEKQQLLQQARQQADASRLAELQAQTVLAAPSNVAAVPEPVTPVAVQPAPVVNVEPVAVVVEAPSPAVVEVVEPVTEPALAPPAVEPKVAPVVEASPDIRPVSKPKAAEPKPAAKKAKGFLGRAMEKIAQMDQKMGFEPNSNASNSEAAAAESEVLTPQPVVQQIEPVAVAQPAQSTEAASKNGKLANLFSRKPKAVVADQAVEVQPTTVAEPEVTAVAEPAAAKGKLGGMLGKLKLKK